MALAERAAEPLGWSTRYLELLGTAIGAAFAAAGRSESTAIPVDAGSAARVAEAMVARAAETGRSPGTARTYGQAWKRVARLADDWRRHQSEAREDEFWGSLADRYRDKRPRRRGPKRSEPPQPSDGNTWYWQSLSATSDVAREIVVNLSEGRHARISVPLNLTPEDRLLLVAAISNDSWRAARVQRVVGHDETDSS